MVLQAKDAVAKASVTAGGAGVYTAIDELNSISMNVAGDNIDVSFFTGDWRKRVQALKDAVYSYSGFWDPADTDGQVAIRNAMINDTELWTQFLPNGTVGFKQEVKVAAFDIEADIQGVLTVAISLEGTGAVATI